MLALAVAQFVQFASLTGSAGPWMPGPPPFAQSVGVKNFAHRLMSLFSTVLINFNTRMGSSTGWFWQRSMEEFVLDLEPSDVTPLRSHAASSTCLNLKIRSCAYLSLKQVTEKQRHHSDRRFIFAKSSPRHLVGLSRCQPEVRLTPTWTNLIHSILPRLQVVGVANGVRIIGNI